jgi:GNAT superfamily N-acetyltransferase
MSISLRLATPTDADAVTALLEASYARLLTTHYDAAILERALPSMTKANPGLLASGTYYVAEADGRPAGCGGWTMRRPVTGEVVEGEAHIRHFATHPDFARQGVGRALIERCFADARARGVHTLSAFATRNAEAFYRAAGFTLIETFDNRLDGHSFPSLLMRRAL